MERITKKDRCGHFYTNKANCRNIYSLDGERLEGVFFENQVLAIDGEAIDKLGRLEDLEEEIGIDLITLYRALNRGIYYKEDNHIFFTTNNIVLVSNELVQVKPTYAVKEATIKSCYYGDCEPLKYLKDAHYWDWKTCNHWKLKDYGVTWSIDRLELENE